MQAGLRCGDLVEVGGYMILRVGVVEGVGDKVVAEKNAAEDVVGRDGGGEGARGDQRLYRIMAEHRVVIDRQRVSHTFEQAGDRLLIIYADAEEHRVAQ